MWPASGDRRIGIELPAHGLRNVSQGKNVNPDRNGNCFLFAEGAYKEEGYNTRIISIRGLGERVLLTDYQNMVYEYLSST
jgi:hypothetical protein